MPLLQTVVRMPYQTGIPRDVSEMTFSFEVADPLVTTFDVGIRNRVQAMFTTNYSGASSYLGQYISPQLLRPSMVFRLIPMSLATGKAIGPFRELPFSVGTAVGTGSMPFEVACVGSFRNANGGSSLPLERRTGRVYFGPLSASVAASGGVPAPSTAFRQAIAQGMQGLADASDADASWSIWSRTAKALSHVDSGWVDNAWDTQRRRGQDATTRLSWVVE